VCVGVCYFVSARRKSNNDKFKSERGGGGRSASGLATRYVISRFPLLFDIFSYTRITYLYTNVETYYTDVCVYRENMSNDSYT